MTVPGRASLALGALVAGLLALGGPAGAPAALAAGLPVAPAAQLPAAPAAPAGVAGPSLGPATLPGAPALPGPVLAHNVLTGSDPADGSSLETGPSRVTLRFDLPVQQAFNTVTVVGPDGGQYQDGAPTVDSTTVTVGVHPLGPAGAYTVGYRVVSDDGHPVSGKVAFTLARAGTGIPNPAGAAPDGQGTDAGAGGEDGGMPAWPWVVGAVLLVGAGAAVALRAGKS